MSPKTGPRATRRGKEAMDLAGVCHLSGGWNQALGSAIALRGGQRLPYTVLHPDLTQLYGYEGIYCAKLWGVRHR